MKYLALISVVLFLAACSKFKGESVGSILCEGMSAPAQVELLVTIYHDSTNYKVKLPTGQVALIPAARCILFLGE